MVDASPTVGLAVAVELNATSTRLELAGTLRGRRIVICTEPKMIMMYLSIAV